jgi:hypothetical protein
VDLARGTRELWRELIPPDPAGVRAVVTCHVTRDGRVYAYSYTRLLSDLYLIEGLR